MNGELEKLTQKRRKWVEANQENGFDEGIKRLLTELYPDNAHFIYELLQNAEDAGASEVSFILSENELKFEHDGQRLFSLRDVDSITSIGVSTKRDDPTSIGKFGVGFKAVFAYTSTPEIHSGDFHFRISDLVIPETRGIYKILSLGSRTRFTFPFNHPTKSAKKALAEIEAGLHALDDSTLLFLTSIQKIYIYSSYKDSYSSLERFEHDDEHVEIQAKHPSEANVVSHWLRFRKEVEVGADDGNLTACRIAIAYQLNEENRKKDIRSSWKITPLNRGQVCIYFPAEKETSNLRFHIHAPFASTVARDSVRDCQANHELRDHLANLVVDSLATIRDQGLLGINFLAVLPNPADHLPEFYEPIRKAIVKAFQTEKLTPTRSGSYAPASALYRGPTRIAEILDDSDLSLLTNYEAPLWAANPPQQHQREDRFLDSLGIDTWGWEELAKLMSASLEDRKAIESWIKQKDDTWLFRFYSLLGEACSSPHYHKISIFPYLNIVRVEISGRVTHIWPGNAFFLIDNSNVPENTYLVKPSIYRSEGTDAQKKCARAFLEHIGVRVFDARVQVESRVNAYPIQKYSSLLNDEFAKDMDLFLGYWKRNPWDTDLFSNHPILLNNNKQWAKPSELCLDASYCDTGLAELRHIHHREPLWDGYKDWIDKAHIKDFIEFVGDVGVMKCLQITKAPLYRNKAYGNLVVRGVRFSKQMGIDEDFSIQGLEDYLRCNSVSCSRLIWNSLIRATDNFTKARYRPNSSYVTKQADSQLVFHLKNHAWIPMKQGTFLKPQEITKRDLRDDFPFDDRNGLLTAIGLGENARRLGEEYQARNQQAKELGFGSAEKAEKWAQLEKLGLSPDDVLAQRKCTEQPDNPVQNPDRRRKGVLENRENALPKESIVRERRIQPNVNITVAEAKAYLRPNYTNSNSELICQCCQNEMPFKVGDAD